MLLSECRHSVIITITHSEKALCDLNARVEAQGEIVPAAYGLGHYLLEERHKGI